MLKKIFFKFIFLFVLSLISANSRVAFSRPGNMIRIPNFDNNMNKNLFSLNASSEILSSTQNSSAFSLSALNKKGYLYGISFVKPVEPTNSIELGFHTQKHMLSYGDVNLDIGIQDILFRQGSDITSANGLDTKGISLFAVISTKKQYFENYAISSHLGFGTGKINQDSHLYLSNPEQNLGIFLGFNFSTSIFKNNGEINFITEFDGKGLNIGLNIPIINNTYLNFGITHFENFGNFATEDKTGIEKSNLTGDAPSITIGMSFNIPQMNNTENNISKLDKEPLGNGIYAKSDTSILFYDPICTEIVETLKDSIKFNNNIISNLNAHNNMLQHSEAILVDSTRKNLLREQVSQSNQNKAMRHLSRSLRYFYDQQYRNALSEINIAIELNPNLAIAYGRRGSIYYKLGDTRRATLNWNVALQLDPEFTEIYQMLEAAEDNRLKAVEISKNIGEIK